MTGKQSCRILLRAGQLYLPLVDRLEQPLDDRRRLFSALAIRVVPGLPRDTNTQDTPRRQVQKSGTGKHFELVGVAAQLKGAQIAIDVRQLIAGNR